MYDKITIIPYILDFGDKETAKKLMDILKEMFKNQYIILIGNVISGNPYIVIRVSNDVKNRINAKKLAKYVSGFIKGGGGGSDEMAECGGRYVEGMKEAFDNLFNYIMTDIRHKQ
jgi:alanyl-tRNA synthetase